MAYKVISDSLKVIGDRGWIGFALVGLVLTAIGAVQKIPYVGDVPDHRVQYLLLALGIGFLVFAAAAYWGLRRYEPEPTKPNAARPRVSTNLARNRTLYGLTVTEPKSRKRSAPTLTVPVTIKVRLKRDPPPGIQIWLFNEGNVRGEMTYWPQEYLNFKDGDWTVTYTPGSFAEGATRTLRFYLVGEEGQALISTYKRINSFHIARAGSGPWEGITKLTSDIGKASDLLHIKLTKGPAKAAMPITQAS